MKHHGLTKLARIFCGAGLTLMIVFWVLLVVRLAAGFASGGLQGARGSLHWVLLAGTVLGEIDQDPITALSRGYENLIISLVITWALSDIYVWLGKRP